MHYLNEYNTRLIKTNKNILYDLRAVNSFSSNSNYSTVFRLVIVDLYLIVFSVEKTKKKKLMITVYLN